MALATQTINLDLRPHYNKQNTNIVYCSQYDSDLRNVVVNIADAGTAVNVSTYTIYVEGTKPDKHGFSYELTSIGGTVANNVVTFPLQLQMTAVAGITNAELVFYSDDERIGSANFILAVEQAGLADDIDVSDTDIPAYVDGAQQAAQAAEDAKDAAVDAKDTAVAVAASIPADYTTLSNDVDDLKNATSQLDSAVFGESLIDASTIATNNNTAVSNNNDGTYTIGTNDYGATTFGDIITLQAGDYLLYGVPNGTAWVSTDRTYGNAYKVNPTSTPIWFTITTPTLCCLGFRMATRPTTAFTIEPYVKAAGIQKKVDDMPTKITAAVNALGNPIMTNASGMSQIPANSDFDTYTSTGNWRVASSAIATTLTHRPSNDAGRLIVSQLANVNNTQQIYIDNGSRIYTRTKGTGDWSAWVQIATMTDITSTNDDVSRSETALDGIYRLTRILESAGTYRINYANAPVCLPLKSYVGNTQNVHPKVLFIENGFGGHKYWMAYTPYPNGNDVYENPCIAYSDDGIAWTNIAGNPLDDPQGNGYNSDTHLVYYNGTMEVWYRYVSSGDTRYETIYRQTSTDGVTWTAKQAVLTSTTAGAVHYLSPAVLFDGTKYQMWVVDNGTIKYYEALASNITSWTLVRSYSLTFTDDGLASSAWHLDVIKDGTTYVMLVMCMVSSSPKNKWSLFICTSTDNITYTTPVKVVQGAPYGWDEYIYRSSIVKISGSYRIYYSAMTGAMVCGIGLTASTALNNFIGQLTL